MKAIYVDQIRRKGYKSEISDLRLDGNGQISSCNPEEITYQDAISHVRDRMVPLTPVTYEMIAHKPKDILYQLLPGQGCLVMNSGKIYLAGSHEVREITQISDMGHSPTGELGEAVQREFDMLQAHTA